MKFTSQLFAVVFAVLAVGVNAQTPCNGEPEGATNACIGKAKGDACAHCWTGMRITGKCGDWNGQFTCTQQA
ncbi:hypothetical protein PM082_016253 [Marasmius tenuissimus]|nr:hypothetical protein PM082_016253 [Marasmius tenuissimus]